MKSLTFICNVEAMFVVAGLVCTTWFTTSSNKVELGGRQLILLVHSWNVLGTYCTRTYTNFLNKLIQY